MKWTNWILASCMLIVFSCSKTDTKPNDSVPIITSDTSDFNGRLYVYTREYSNGKALGSSDVFLFTQYEDIKRNLYLNYLRSSSSAGIADFGYVLQGNYYVVSNNGFKNDTALIQVLGRRENVRYVYLK